MSGERMFPILNDPIIRAIPWDAIAPHEKQAQANHYQTLKRLAERGGLCVAEAVVVMLDKPFPINGFKAAQLPELRSILMTELKKFEQAQGAQHG